MVQRPTDGSAATADREAFAMTRASAIAVAVSEILLLAALGCDGTIGGDDVGGGDGGVGQPDAGPECIDNADCPGGLCLDGACCASEDVCDGVCCGDGETCFANQCVVPGDECRTAADCGEDEYCESGLYDGPPDPDPAPGCEPLPPPGYCLEMAPTCADGEEPTDDNFCIPVCEYHPPTGLLDAEEMWHWGPVADVNPEFTDVWATPTVGRLYDANCDGVVDQLDPPNVVFVSGNARGTCCSCGGYTPSTCHTGVLRVLDGVTGEEVWSLRKASADSIGFMGLSVALGDLDGDQRVDIAAVTGEGYLVVVNGEGEVTRTSDFPIGGASAGAFGWGGGLAVADMDHDGHPEIAYGKTVFTTAGGGLTRLFEIGEGGNQALSIITQLDDDPELELLAGDAAYNIDGSPLWTRTDLPAGHTAVGDFDLDGIEEVVLVGAGKVWILDAATGETLLGPVTMGGSGAGGPPTVADFDGDGRPEVGVAQANFYTVVEPDLGDGTLSILWQAPNHDLSSSVTGSTVFDFEGDGKAEVIYNDECFLWVYDGTTGAVRFATPTTSFTATEASVVADVDGDGHAEMIMISNGANPESDGWKCNVAPWNQPDPANNRPAWAPPPGANAYRGITVFGDSARSWVGTRALWNQHSYHVTNVCDDHDDACPGDNTHGTIPQWEELNCTVPWLNNYRQNVQDQGLFDAPDATVRVKVDCASPVVVHAYVQNLGAAQLPAGVEVGFYYLRNGVERDLGTGVTDHILFPGQVAEVTYTAQPGDQLSLTDPYFARILVDPAAPTFRECRDDNNQSAEAFAVCIN